eukprot:3682953-Rhodomonas_salina.2
MSVVVEQKPRSVPPLQPVASRPQNRCGSLTPFIPRYVSPSRGTGDAIEILRIAELMAWIVVV